MHETLYVGFLGPPKAIVVQNTGKRQPLDIRICIIIYIYNYIYIYKSSYWDVNDFDGSSSEWTLCLAAWKSQDSVHMCITTQVPCGSLTWRQGWVDCSWYLAATLWSSSKACTEPWCWWCWEVCFSLKGKLRDTPRRVAPIFRTKMFAVAKVEFQMGTGAFI